jgi:thermitase
VYLTCRQIENQPGNAGHDGIFHYTVYVTSEQLLEFPYEIKLGPKNCQIHLKPNKHENRKSLLVRSFAFANGTISWRFWTSRTTSMKSGFILDRFVYHLESTPLFNIIKDIFDMARQRTSPVIERDFDLDALIHGVRDEQSQYKRYDVEYKEYYPGAPRDAGIAYYGSDQVVIGFKTWVNVEEKDGVDGFPIVDKIVELNTVVVEIYGIDTEDFIDMVLLREDVEYAELNFIYQTCYTPNDPLWDQQWGPKVINCPEAWAIEKGAHIANIAVIDTGCNRFHEDISNKPSFDYDFVNNDDDPIDDNGHGTHCTGIATGIIDNEKGIAGIAQVGSLHIKVLDAGGAGYISDIAKGIVYVCNPSYGVKVISMSLGGYGLSVLLHLACDYARYIKGKFLVAAAGNEGVSHLCFPARYRSVVSVGAVDKNLKLCQWSNHGSNLDLVAPGESIISTIGDNQYKKLSGTSMATPHVAGVAALYFSRNYNHPPALCEGKLFSTAIKLSTSCGHGLVNAQGVVQRSIKNNMLRFPILFKILQHLLAILP